MFSKCCFNPHKTKRVNYPPAEGSVLAASASFPSLPVGCSTGRPACAFTSLPLLTSLCFALSDRLPSLFHSLDCQGTCSRQPEGSGGGWQNSIPKARWCLPRSPRCSSSSVLCYPRFPGCLWQQFLGLLASCPELSRKGWCWWGGCRLHPPGEERRLFRRASSLPAAIPMPVAPFQWECASCSALQAGGSLETTRARGAPGLSQAQERSCCPRGAPRLAPPQTRHRWPSSCRMRPTATACRHDANVGVSAHFSFDFCCQNCGPVSLLWSHIYPVVTPRHRRDLPVRSPVLAYCSLLLHHRSLVLLVEAGWCLPDLSSPCFPNWPAPCAAPM